MHAHSPETPAETTAGRSVDVVDGTKIRAPRARGCRGFLFSRLPRLPSAGRSPLSRSARPLPAPRSSPSVATLCRFPLGARLPALLRPDPRSVGTWVNTAPRSFPPVSDAVSASLVTVPATFTVSQRVPPSCLPRSPVPSSRNAVLRSPWRRPNGGLSLPWGWGYPCAGPSEGSERHGDTSRCHADISETLDLRSGVRRERHGGGS